jgi:mono/diheme cytochrome c family protein
MRHRPILAIAMRHLSPLLLAALTIGSAAAQTSQSAEQQGAALAAIGNCAGCHTLHERRPFAGGVPLHTPFGVIYGSNITPDQPTGIGSWSKADFIRAMRDGIAKDGTHLYPAFPYDHFTRSSDADLDLLYTFVMSREPIASTPPKDELSFPYDQRGLMGFWNALYLDRDARLDPSPDHPVQRGAYLAQSLGHCDSCHSPRNGLGAEIKARMFDGGTVDGWYAPALNRNSPSPSPWTVEQLSEYLRFGIADGHAMAGGPMHDVVMSLAHANKDDVNAIASFVVSMMSQASSTTSAARSANLQRSQVPLAALDDNSSPLLARGALVYRSSCASCHDDGRGPSSDSALQMPLAIAVYEPDPHSLLHIIREGIWPIDGGARRMMPAFDASLSDEDLNAVAAYLRKDAAGLAPWPDLERAVADTRE